MSLKLSLRGTGRVWAWQMPEPLVLAIQIAKLVVDIALWSLLGQGAVALIAGRRRDGNPVYQLFCLITRPAISTVRWFMPAAILDRHLPVLTFFLLFWISIALALLKRWAVQ